MKYVRHIYMKNPCGARSGTPQLYLHSPLHSTCCIPYCIYSSILRRFILMSVVFSVKLPVELEFQLLYIGGGTNCLENAINTGVLNAQHFGGLHIVETDDTLNGTSTAQMAQKQTRIVYSTVCSRRSTVNTIVPFLKST